MSDFENSILSSDELFVRLKHTIPQPQLNLQNIENLLKKYQKEPLPSNSKTADLNKILKNISFIGELGGNVRGEVGICLAHIKVWNSKELPQTMDEICKQYDLPVADTSTDLCFMMYCYYLKAVLSIIDPHKHRDFIIQEVLVPISGDYENKSEYKTGGGTENARTVRRYKAFELESRMFRAKTVQQMWRTKSPL